MVADIQPLHLVTDATLKSSKYAQIVSSVREGGLVEPPVVARDPDASEKYILGWTRPNSRFAGAWNVSVECLIATDDEAFTYNKRISRIAIIQEHLMILKAIDRGVPEEVIAATLNVNVQQIKLKKRLLKGICPEVIDLLKDQFAPMNTLAELRKMAAMRQIEAAQLMLAMNKFSINYAKSLVGATPESQLVDSGAKKSTGLTEDQMAMMEQESASLDREFRLIEDSYGADNLDLVLANGYLIRLLENARVVRYLAKNFPELLGEFQKMADPSSRAA